VLIRVGRYNEIVDFDRLCGTCRVFDASYCAEFGPGEFSMRASVRSTGQFIILLQKAFRHS